MKPTVRRLRICGIAMLTGCLSMGGLCKPVFAADVMARLAKPQADTANQKQKQAIPAVIWLEPVRPDAALTVAPGNFVLLQKNKMFTPHLLVVPVGSSVAFPNADPFFHNVFSLFEGKRFDLGLYEAGSKRSVVFSREGVSYIFCNIHSEMSAVVIALSTPLYSVADAESGFHLKSVPEGDYELHVWIEGRHQDFLDQQTRHLHIAADTVDLGIIPSGPPSGEQHLNKFGKPYDPDAKPIY